ncbi:MarR family transcriptional regulator [Mycobacterium sp. UM_CSW]|uniref:MarR family transcriptional regulator n=1 Tax=Mycobacterium sp. UM_CSW TaxID=1370119 RepID=UPI000836ED97|nr:MarR family transcriptional regulator [Mycobacterium sp. UM_CSW]
MSTTDVDALRERSRDAFGQDYQLEVMLEIFDTKGSVNMSEVAASLGLTTSQVQSAWKRLTKVGLLELISRRHRTKLYRRRKSAAWSWARELAGDLWVRD